MRKAEARDDMEHFTQILTGGDIAGLMRPADYRAAVERAFKAAADGRGCCPPPMQIEGAMGGGFHVKGAGFGRGQLTPEGRSYVAFKVNGNFPGNPARCGLPTIQGVVVLCDGEDGSVLALMDSAEVTLQRTAAASAVAAARLARPDAAVITICGCGEQGRAQLLALADVLPLRSGFLWDRDPLRAERLAGEAQAAGLSMTVTGHLRAATRQSEVIVTCTTTSQPFLTPDHVSPGTFIAAVGADYPTKNEIAPGLMAQATVVADILAQCAGMGDLRHAIAAGAMSAEDVHAELAEVVTGRKPGRTSAAEITLFDSTGTAIQDVASAAVIYERAQGAGVGLSVQLG
jgi:ornithine cyclodeaminase/alanine dehydrogenase-like protein (mu-crystallin family)